MEICLQVIVISRYEYDIIVITRDQGGTEVKCNNNDMIRVNGVGTNSGMDYWNGPLDWTTGLSYFLFWICFCIYLSHFPGSYVPGYYGWM